MIEILKPLRIKIDSLDEQLVNLLVEREKIVRQVAKIKAEHNIPVVLPDRIEEVINKATENTKSQGGNEEYVRAVYKRIIELSCDIETADIERK